MVYDKIIKTKATHWRHRVASAFLFRAISPTKKEEAKMMKKVKVALEIVELVVSIGTILSQAGEALVSLFDKEQKE